MYTVTVRDHMLVAHSLKGEVFGKAQNLHGATYIVEAEFKRPELDQNNTVIDVGMASRILKEVISQIDYQNLDERGEFHSHITTTEFLARYIHGQIATRVGPSFEGKLRITLRESPVVWGSYEGDVA